MQQGLCNVTVSVRLPVCPSYRLLQQRAAGLLLWIGGQEISIDCFTAGAQQQWRTAARRSAAKASSVAVYSCRRRLNTGLVFVISDLHFSLSATCFFCVSTDWNLKTSSSAIAEEPREASCQLKSCQLPRNSAETTCTRSPEEIEVMKLKG